MAEPALSLSSHTHTVNKCCDITDMEPDGFSDRRVCHPVKQLNEGKVVFSWTNMVIILFLEPRFVKVEKHLLM